MLQVSSRSGMKDGWRFSIGAVAECVKGVSMGLGWLDVTNLSFNVMLLLDRIQISWFPGWVPKEPLSIALEGNPHVKWYLGNKCPEIKDWLDELMGARKGTTPTAGQIREAEIAVMEAINDWLTYVVAPDVYDQLPFHGWDSKELTDLVDFTNKIVMDIGSGTGRQALLAAPTARVVYAVEPVGNLRFFLNEKARNLGFDNVHPVEGLLEDLPFHNDFADIIMGGHVFGEYLDGEYRELTRVTRPGGMIILIPGNNDCDNDVHAFLIAKGFNWGRFEEPVDGWKRKYWKEVAHEKI